MDHVTLISEIFYNIANGILSKSHDFKIFKNVFMTSIYFYINIDDIGSMPAM